MIKIFIIGIIISWLLWNFFLNTISQRMIHNNETLIHNMMKSPKPPPQEVIDTIYNEESIFKEKDGKIRVFFSK